jgi:hypothetical protein
MDVTSIPHDSYYKFMFLGGVVLILTSIFFFEENEKNHENHSLIRDSIRVEFRSDSTKRARYGEIIPNLRSVTDAKLSAMEKKNINDFTSQALDELDKMNSRFNQNEHRLNLIDHQHQHFENARWRYLVIFAFGIIFIGIGGTKWEKEQKIKDKILQSQLDILELDYEQKKNETSSKD